MALHRDIYWVGKQWAVTGLGIQACNQKQKSQFDIEASRLWEDGVQDAVRAEKWVNTDDFEKAVTVARKYYPEPPRKAAPPQAAVSSPIHVAAAPEPEPPRLVSPKFDMHSEGALANLRPVWRVR
ncbi:hypothetical protein, partial [Bradyrhizobium sp.]|uniref:hypothetical protein n=1 Tax=Bradyrhizobium sp. TaxID=376 RepID=UPI003C5C2BC6